MEHPTEILLKLQSVSINFNKNSFMAIQLHKNPQNKILILVCLIFFFVIFRGMAAEKLQDILHSIFKEDHQSIVEAENQIAKNLKGRETEVWEFTKNAIASIDPNFTDLYIISGLRALNLLDGYNEKILGELHGILKNEAEFGNDLNQWIRGGEFAGPEPEKGIPMLKRVAIIGMGLEIFNSRDLVLEREIIYKFMDLPSFDVQLGIANWFQKFGDSSDIERLESTKKMLIDSSELQSADKISEVVTYLKNHKKVEPSTKGSLNHEKFNNNAISETTQPQAVQKSSFKGVYVLGVMAMFFIILMVVVFRKKQNDTSQP